MGPPALPSPRARTHQTAEVRPLEPGGGETQRHVRGAFSHLSLQVVGVGRAEAAAAVATAGLCCSCVRPAPPLTPTTPRGQEVGGGSQANVPPPLGICIERGWWGVRESEGEKVPREMWVPVGEWGQGGASVSQSV